MEAKKIQELIAKYLDGEATANEKTFVEEWYDSIRGEEYSNNSYYLNRVKNEAKISLFSEIDSKNALILHNTIIRHDKTASLDKTEIKSDLLSSKERKLYPYLTSFKWIAAIFIAVLSVTFYISREKRQENAETKKVAISDIKPGGNKALLTLADGSVVLLDSAKNGIVTAQGNTIIEKSSDGNLVYRNNGIHNSLQQGLSSNTIATPRGGQFQVQLQDGTKVWLNASSSLKFPTTFVGTKRFVELTGQAYFEVAKNAKMPFIVKSSGQLVEVLGTHFDINAYSDEQVIKTTLIEGSVKVIAQTKSATLKPGQQSAFSNESSDPIVIKDNIDLNEILAWKNEMFQFDDADIRMIMRQVARWYDVDVVFVGRDNNEHFSGKISRNENLSQILKILELSGARFKIEGKKIIVK